MTTILVFFYLIFNLKALKEIIFNLKILCENCLEPLREKLGKPLYISSGYRCKQLNTLIGGSKTSSHMVGQAADIKVKGIDTEFLFNEIIGSDIKFDQLIQEFDSWVHISCTTKNRNQIMRAIIENGKTKYLLL